MKKTMIVAALMALVATGANAKKAADSAEVAKNKPVFTVVKQNPITSIKDQNRSGTGLSSTSTICRLFSRIICLSRGSKAFPVSIIIGLS